MAKGSSRSSPSRLAAATRASRPSKNDGTGCALALDLILDQRRADMDDVPGGASGLLARDYQGNGSIGW